MFPQFTHSDSPRTLDYNLHPGRTFPWRTLRLIISHRQGMWGKRMWFKSTQCRENNCFFKMFLFSHNKFAINLCLFLKVTSFSILWIGSMLCSHLACATMLSYSGEDRAIRSFASCCLVLFEVAARVLTNKANELSKGGGYGCWARAKTSCHQRLENPRTSRGLDKKSNWILH